MKKMNKKGFTLAELLIVVAIIAVLVAIAIPIFSSQLEKSRDTTDAANLRAAYAQAQIELMENRTVNSGGTATNNTGDASTGGAGYSYKSQTSDAAWAGNTDPSDALGFTSSDSSKVANGTKIRFITNSGGEIIGYKWATS